MNNEKLKEIRETVLNEKVVGDLFFFELVDNDTEATEVKVHETLVNYINQIQIATVREAKREVIEDLLEQTVYRGLGVSKEFYEYLKQLKTEGEK